MHYLLDTNALVCLYSSSSDFQKYRNTINDASNTIHILEICIPEVISIFYKKHFAEKDKTKQITLNETRDLRTTFIMDIRNNKFLIHPVMARDIIETDKIWEVAEKVYYEKLKSTGKDFIDSTDALVLALATHLSKTKGIKNDFALITNDTHLYETAKVLGINVKKTSEFMK